MSAGFVVIQSACKKNLPNSFQLSFVVCCLIFVFPISNQQSAIGNEVINHNFYYFTHQVISQLWEVIIKIENPS